MSAPRINAHKAQLFQVDYQEPDAHGVLGVPAAGTVTGITLRLSANRYGAAIAGDVGGLPATEQAEPGRFAVLVSKALMESRIVPLGQGVAFHAVWSKTGVGDNDDVAFVVELGTVVV